MILAPLQHDCSGDAELLSELAAGPFRVTHKSYTCDFAQSYHEHEQGSIDFILQGGGRGIYCGREIVSCAGMVEFFREEIRHKFVGGGGGIRTMHVLLPADVLREMDAIRNISVEAMTHTQAQRIALRLLSEITTPDRSSPLEIESLIHELLDEVVCASTKPTVRAGWMGVACDYLSSVHDRSVTLSELAAVASINRAHLARVFKSKLGISVGTHHRNLRAQRAAEQLASSDLSISRVAHAAGFSDQAHLTRVFRDRFGVTPSAYRSCLRRR
jgi:AraC-like DNA-binding protein